MNTTTLERRQRVMDLVGGCWTTQVAGTATQLGIPDLIGDGMRSARAIASETGCAEGPVYRLLRAMCALGLAVQGPDGRFRLSEAGALLRSDVEGSLASLAQAWAGRRWSAFGRLADSVRTGTPVPGGFNTASADPAVGVAASRAQVDRSRLPAQQAAASYDWGRFARVLDVGGGHGTVLAAILASHCSVGGAVFDLPHHEPQTLALLAAEGVADRGGFVGGSFFDGVPRGHDAIVLKSILHDWTDAPCRDLLARCRAALEIGGTLIVMEELLPEIATPDPAVASAFRTDLTMLVSTGGLERTEAEYRQLIVDAGFQVRAVVATASEFSLIEAVAR